MSDSKKFPEIPKSLIEELEKRFPNKVPTSKSYSYEDFRYLQGQLSVIEFLRHHFDQQNKTILEKS